MPIMRIMNMQVIQYKGPTIVLFGGRVWQLFGPDRNDLWSLSFFKFDKEHIREKGHIEASDNCLKYYFRGRRDRSVQIVIYYTLRFYFPYLSLLAQPVNIFVDWPVNILVYGPGRINIMFSSGFCPNSFFVLDIQ